eukprot:6206292-Pleurochrysis_carterae.AAC.2
MHLFSSSSVASFSSNFGAMGRPEMPARWAGPRCRRAGAAHRKIGVDLPADNHSPNAPARRVVFLRPDAQLALDNAVEALDAALALAVASSPVHHLADWPKLPHLLNDPIQLLLTQSQALSCLPDKLAAVVGLQDGRRADDSEDVHERERNRWKPLALQRAVVVELYVMVLVVQQKLKGPPGHDC